MDEIKQNINNNNNKKFHLIHGGGVLNKKSKNKALSKNKTNKKTEQNKQSHLIILNINYIYYFNTNIQLYLEINYI